MMFARTKRLTLRPGWPEDAPALSQAIGHESVATRLARVPWPYALGDAQSFLAQPRGGGGVADQRRGGLRRSLGDQIDFHRRIVEAPVAAGPLDRQEADHDDVQRYRDRDAGLLIPPWCRLRRHGHNLRVRL